MPATPDMYQPCVLMLLRKRLSAGGQIRLRVQGSSMLPLLRPGDTVCIAPCSSRHLRPGDIILFQRGSALITHRLLSCSLHSLQTRGDSCRVSDRPIHASDMLGRVVAIERAGVSYPIRQHTWHWLYRVLGMLARLERHVQWLRSHLQAAVPMPCCIRPLFVLLACAHASFRLLLRCCLLLAAQRFPG